MQFVRNVLLGRILPLQAQQVDGVHETRPMLPGSTAAAPKSRAAIRSRRSPRTTASTAAAAHGSDQTAIDATPATLPPPSPPAPRPLLTSSPPATTTTISPATGTSTCTAPQAVNRPVRHPLPRPTVRQGPVRQKGNVRQQPGNLRLAIVGDVHGSWLGAREEAALRLLGPELTLLVGDFGNEDVELVRQVASLPLPKAVILGNHDAWYTMTGRANKLIRRGPQVQPQDSKRPSHSLHQHQATDGSLQQHQQQSHKQQHQQDQDRNQGQQQQQQQPHKPQQQQQPHLHQARLTAADILAATRDQAEGLAATQQDRVRQQLEALGSSHVGYGSCRLDDQGYTVVGARPFSKGGRDFGNIRAFMEELYGVRDLHASAQRIIKAAEAAPPHHPLIVMGHNGPAGLGSCAYDICGVDWTPGAGDHGDLDLQTALAALHRSGRRIPLVTFGHMHHALKPGVAPASTSPSHNNRSRKQHSNSRSGTRQPQQQRFRRMAVLDPATGTLYLNAATVPRVTLAPPFTATTRTDAASGAAVPVANAALAATPASPVLPAPAEVVTTSLPSTAGAFLTPAAQAAAATAPAKPPSPSTAPYKRPSTSPKSYGSGRRARMAVKAAKAAVAAARMNQDAAAAAAAALSTAAMATTAAGGAVTAAAAAAGAGEEAAGGADSNPRGTVHHYVLAELRSGEVVSARDVWVQVTPVVAGGEGVEGAPMDAEASSPASPLSISCGLQEEEEEEEEKEGRSEEGHEVSGYEGEAEVDEKAEVDEDEDEEEEGGDGGGPECTKPRRMGAYVVQIVRQHEVLRTVVSTQPQEEKEGSSEAKESEAEGGSGRASAGSGGVVKFVWDAYDQRYEPYVMPSSPPSPSRTTD